MTQDAILARIEQIKADPSTSKWLSNAIDQLIARDPIDALRDVEVLLDLLQQRLQQLIQQPSNMVENV